MEMDVSRMKETKHIYQIEYKDAAYVEATSMEDAISQLIASAVNDTLHASQCPEIIYVKDYTDMCNANAMIVHGGTNPSWNYNTDGNITLTQTLGGQNHE